MLVVVVRGRVVGSGASAGSLGVTVGKKEASARAGSRHERGSRVLFGHQIRHKKTLVFRIAPVNPTPCAVFIRSRLPLFLLSICSHIICDSEGVQYGCGHYIVTDRLSKDDCCDQFCMNSDLHPERRCSGCGETCKRVCTRLLPSIGAFH